MNVVRFFVLCGVFAISGVRMYGLQTTIAINQSDLYSKDLSHKVKDWKTDVIHRKDVTKTVKGIGPNNNVYTETVSNRWFVSKVDAFKEKNRAAQRNETRVENLKTSIKYRSLWFVASLASLLGLWHLEKTGNLLRLFNKIGIKERGASSFLYFGERLIDLSLMANAVAVAHALFAKKGAETNGVRLREERDAVAQKIEAHLKENDNSPYKFVSAHWRIQEDARVTAATRNQLQQGINPASSSAPGGMEILRQATTSSSSTQQAASSSVSAPATQQTTSANASSTASASCSAQ